MMQQRRTGKWTKLLAAIAVLLIAQIAYAEYIFLSTEAFVDGVDETGAQDFERGAIGRCLIVKNTDTGRILQVCVATVENASGVTQIYKNFGSEVFDPELLEFQIATADIVRIGPTGRARQLSIALAETEQ